MRETCKRDIAVNIPIRTRPSPSGYSTCRLVSGAKILAWKRVPVDTTGKASPATRARRSRRPRVAGLPYTHTQETTLVTDQAPREPASAPSAGTAMHNSSATPAYDVHGVRRQSPLQRIPYNRSACLRRRQQRCALTADTAPIRWRYQGPPIWNLPRPACDPPATAGTHHQELRAGEPTHQ